MSKCRPNTDRRKRLDDNGPRMNGKMKVTEVTWLKSVDPSAISEAMEEACVDCYGQDEQWSGLFEMVGQELAFPFSAKVLGELVEVVDTKHPKFDAFGLDLVVVHKKKKYAIAAHSVELLKPLPEGHLLLAGFLDWKANQ